MNEYMARIAVPSEYNRWRPALGLGLMAPDGGAVGTW